MVLALVLVAPPGVARAQISPGPLAAAHGSLEGTRRCVECHGAGGTAQMTARCLACHEEIAWLVRRERGLHAKVAKQACGSCHPDHAGQEFALISWPDGSRDRFDHRRAGWPLDGGHAKVKCADCHMPKYRVSPAARLSDRKGPDWGWVGLERACISCHADPHKGQLGRACADCHVTSSWRTVNRAGFNHDRTRYPLRGAHVTVRCEKCHDFSSGKVVRSAGFATCTACHADAHAGTATLAGRPVDCESCHNVQGWRPSTYTVAAHARTRYPLEGRHRDVGCDKCHVDNPPGVPAVQLGTAGTWMRPPFARCRDCHGEDHGEQLARRADGGPCESCHKVAGWSPATYTIAEHARAGFALEGRHAKVECAACHGPERPGLPALPPRRVLGAAGVALQLAETECAACHADPHQRRYPRCPDCHDARDFRPSTIDIAAHRRYRFALEDAHGAVLCVACHRDMERPRATSSLVLAARTIPRMLFGAPPGGCRGCHETPHGSQFARRSDRGACESCHATAAFRPATRFDHNRHAAFSLKGAHAGVPCARCHPSVRQAGGKTVVIYRPVSSKCESCHGENVRRPA